MAIEFTDIDKNLPNGENMGGVPQKFYVGYHDDVATWPTKPANPAAIDANAELTGSLVMKTGKRLFEIYFTEDTGELKFNPVGEKDGKSFNIEFSMFHPGLQAKILGFINAAKNANLVLVVPDSNGNKFVLGDDNRAASFDGESDGIGVGKTTADRAGIGMKFSYKCASIYKYTGTIPLTPAT